jgi:hypothetical protein
MRGSLKFYKALVGRGKEKAHLGQMGFSLAVSQSRGVLSKTTSSYCTNPGHRLELD